MNGIFCNFVKFIMNIFAYEEVAENSRYYCMCSDCHI